MTTYTLRVFHEGRAEPTKSIHLPHASQVLERIPALLAAHPDCFRIQVSAGGMHLFSVDCAGNAVRD